MKIKLLLLGLILLAACRERSHTDRDDLVAEWDPDGRMMTVMRKGIPIATFRNFSNGCFIELTGTDGVADVTATYMEEGSASLAASPLNILLGWRVADGEMKIVSYDSKGNIVMPEESPTER